MRKVRIEDLKVFRTIADVIGEARARCELFKLQGANLMFSDVRNLSGAFPWIDTPQGSMFWRKINKGINPYD